MAETHFAGTQPRPVRNRPQPPLKGFLVSAGCCRRASQLPHSVPIWHRGDHARTRGEFWGKGWGHRWVLTCPNVQGTPPAGSFAFQTILAIAHEQPVVSQKKSPAWLGALAGLRGTSAPWGGVGDDGTDGRNDCRWLVSTVAATCWFNDRAEWRGTAVCKEKPRRM